jgi:hypothetical protein
MRLKIIFRSLLNYLVIRSRSGRFQKNELKRLTSLTERLIGVSLQYDPLNPLEISLRITILVKISIDSVMTMKLRIKKLIYAGLESVRAISIP